MFKDFDTLVATFFKIMFGTVAIIGGLTAILVAIKLTGVLLGSTLGCAVFLWICWRGCKKYLKPEDFLD